METILHSIMSYNPFLILAVAFLVPAILASLSLAYILRPTPKAERSEYQSNHIYRK
jgi:hypothetical protein